MRDPLTDEFNYNLGGLFWAATGSIGALAAALNGTSVVDGAVVGAAVGMLLTGFGFVISLVTK